MESGMLFKMAGVYNFVAAAVCAVIAQRTMSENIILSTKDLAINNAILTAIHAATNFQLDQILT
jgi:uridine phosphorylase